MEENQARSRAAGCGSKESGPKASHGEENQRLNDGKNYQEGGRKSKEINNSPGKGDGASGKSIAVQEVRRR
jgi:hypothetical protein